MTLTLPIRIVWRDGKRNNVITAHTIESALAAFDAITELPTTVECIMWDTQNCRIRGYVRPEEG